MFHRRLRIRRRINSCCVVADCWSFSFWNKSVASFTCWGWISLGLPKVMAVGAAFTIVVPRNMPSYFDKFSLAIKHELVPWHGSGLMSVVPFFSLITHWIRHHFSDLNATFQRPLRDLKAICLQAKFGLTSLFLHSFAPKQRLAFLSRLSFLLTLWWWPAILSVYSTT